MVQEAGIRAVIAELGIEPGFDFDELLNHAEHIHEKHKTADLQVSRSTLLYAAMQRQPLVKAVLEANGLRQERFEQKLRFSSSPKVDIEREFLDWDDENQTPARALQDYVSRWPKRPLDALGLAACIVANASGFVEESLRTSGLNIQVAKARLATLVDASEDLFIRASQAGYRFVGLAQNAIAAARILLVEHDIELPPLTTSSVMIALLLPHPEGPALPEFLHQYVASQVSDDMRQATLEQWWMPCKKGRSSTFVDSYSQPLAAVFERALQIAASASRAPMIEERHLVGSIIASAKWEEVGSADLLATLGIEPDALARAFLNWLVQNAPPTGGDDLAAWRRFLDIRGETFLARFSAEEIAGEDWLQINDHVQAFATMIASDHITPPLAIGLFGDWGSGKSFFMAKLRQAITQRAERAQRNPKGSPYYSRIVQIEFNAWHYVESNLWASLVENVFSNLKLTTGEHEKSVAERRAELAKQIDALIADRAAVEEKLQKAEVARTQAANELEAKAKHAETSASGLRGLQAVNVWELVQIDDASRDALNDALQKLGVKAALKSRDDIRKTLDDLREAGKRAETIRSWIAQRPLGLVVLAVLILAAPFAVVPLTRSLPDLTQTITQLLAPLGAALVWLAARVKQANGIFETVDDARKAIDEKVDAAERLRQSEVQAADDRLKTAVADVEAAKTALQEKEQAVAAAKNDLIELSRGRRLARFINERAESDDYRKLLGVLATVRHDFSTLSRLMYPEENEASTLDDAFHLDRIILYIDDLDRCHPDRVVEVLQAVHLLLAFKLFVVVVGVDARWVLDSLHYKHRALREKSGTNLREDENELLGYAAKPHDYLEKIFQVPFWLEPLSPPTTARYISHLLADDVADENVVPSSGGADTPRTNVNASSSSTSTGRPSRQATTRQRKATDVDPKALTIRQRELDFMETPEISKLVGRSPRTAKRFVNTYRFMRAGIQPDELDDYLDQETALPRYKAALTLLAIVVGAPDVSLEVFNRIKLLENTQLPLRTLATSLDAVYASHPDLDEWLPVSEALKALSNGDGTVAALRPYVDDVARYSFRPPYAQLALRKQRPRDPFPIRIVQPPRNT